MSVQQCFATDSKVTYIKDSNLRGCLMNFCSIIHTTPREYLQRLESENLDENQLTYERNWNKINLNSFTFTVLLSKIKFVKVGVIFITMHNVITFWYNK